MNFRQSHPTLDNLLQNRAYIARALFLLLAFTAICHGESRQNEQVEGLCIYKSNTSLPDGAAVAFEYRTVINYADVSYVFAVGSGRIRVPAHGEIVCFPYPGRVMNDRESAIALLRAGQRRFPAYASRLAAIERAWNRYAGKSSDDGSSRRLAALRQMEQSNRNVETTAASHVSTPSLSTTKLSPASLRESKPTSPTDTASSTNRAPADPDDSIDSLVKNAPKPVPASDPDSLNKNLNIIQRFYRTAARLVNPDAAFEDTAAPLPPESR